MGVNGGMGGRKEAGEREKPEEAKDREEREQAEERTDREELEERQERNKQEEREEREERGWAVRCNASTKTCSMFPGLVFTMPLNASVECLMCFQRLGSNAHHVKCLGSTCFMF